jgi:hypothetical protein
LIDRQVQALDTRDPKGRKRAGQTGYCTDFDPCTNSLVYDGSRKTKAKQEDSRQLQSPNARFQWAGQDEEYAKKKIAIPASSRTKAVKNHAINGARHYRLDIPS